ncbi:hypothetical protein FOZ61_001369 [Perkinsus olseni]|uniref:CCDC81 HU domain-containing protein n=2 Tax=Perkinsus olseni TaxID=32597 RepID=A0A7J6LX19_PEROL|nr:hypothetical protein FOZ61_001369 [Perkinsus olseni]
MTVVIQVPQLIEFVLSNPKFFPGLHNASQPRTSKGLQSLDPQRQLEAIWHAMSAYIQEILESGKGVRIEHFGAFTFEPLVAPYGNPKNFRSSALRLRPCFVPDDHFKATLRRYAGKEETPVREGSIYQQGINMMYLNKVPIAAGLFLKTQVVVDGVKALFKGVQNLSSRDYNMDLDFKFCRVQILEGDLKAKFSTSLVVEAQKDARQWPTREASTNPLPTLAQAMNAADSCEKTDSSEHSEQVPQRISETWKNPNVSRAMTELIQPRDEVVHDETSAPDDANAGA